MCIGSIIGDYCGSPYEGSKRFFIGPLFLFNKKCKFTDDSILTVSIMDSLLKKIPYEDSIRQYALKYPHAGYGRGFKEWLKNNSGPYNSYGNGSMMRVSPIGWAFNSVNEVLEEAKKSAEITHNHCEGIMGAQAIALAIYLARITKNKQIIKEEISKRFGYNLDMKISEIPKGFDNSCQATAPLCFSVFFGTNSFVSAIKTAIKLGGDADTNAAIVGSIAEAYYGNVPDFVINEIFFKLNEELKLVVLNFIDKYVDSEFFIKV